MRTYSACVPSIVWPSTQPPLRQCEYMPLLQESQVPQAVMHETSTRSPGSKPRTAEPVCSITPMPSCPSVRPSQTLGTSPLRMCRSVPQIVAVVMRTMASVASSSSGRGLSSQERRPGPW
jgi:hypothetical protein